MGTCGSGWGVALVVETRCRLRTPVGGARSGGGGMGCRGCWCATRAPYGCKGRCREGEAGGFARDGAVVGVGARHAHPAAAKDAVGGAKPGALPRMVRSWALVRDTRTLRLRRTPWGGEAGGVAKDGAVVGVGARHAHPTAAKDAVRGGAKPGASQRIGRSWALVRDTRTLRLRRTLSGGRSRGLCTRWVRLWRTAWLGRAHEAEAWGGLGGARVDCEWAGRVSSSWWARAHPMRTRPDSRCCRGRGRCLRVRRRPT